MSDRTPSPRQRRPFRRRVLLAVTGLTPQIITETIHALAVQSSPSWVPTEIQVITTTWGADLVVQRLLNGPRGWFHRLVREYGLPDMAFPGSRFISFVSPTGGGMTDE